MYNHQSVWTVALTFRSFHFKNVSSVTLVRFCVVRAALWNQQHSAVRNNIEHYEHRLDSITAIKENWQRT